MTLVVQHLKQNAFSYFRKPMGVQLIGLIRVAYSIMDVHLSKIIKETGIKTDLEIKYLLIFPQNRLFIPITIHCNALAKCKDL